MFAHTQNICLHVKYPHTSRYSRPWNIRAHETFAPMKHSRPWNIRAYLKYLRIYKIYAPQLKCSRLIIYDSNKAAVEIFASYDRCMRPENRRPNSYYLGSAESPTSDSFSVWLKSSFRWCCLSSMQSSSEICSQTAQLIWAVSLPYCTAKIFAPCQMFAAANISTFFLGIKNLTRLTSVLSLQFKFVHNHKNCPNSA